MCLAKVVPGIRRHAAVSRIVDADAIIEELGDLLPLLGLEPSPSDAATSRPGTQRIV